MSRKVNTMQQPTASPSDVVCTVERVTHSYGTRTALKNVSFSMSAGSVTGLVGANGSGKSTLLRILAGVQRPTSGRVVQFDGDLARSESSGRGIGAAVDGMALWPGWTVRRNLEYLTALAGVPRTEIPGALDAVGLAAAAPSRLRTLSLGNRQRVSLAAAILVGRRIVLLDEPMNGLDPEARQAVRDLIIRLAGQGKTVVLSSHDLHDVESLCGRLVVLSEGELAFAGSTSAYRDSTMMATLRVDAAAAEQAQIDLAGSGIHCRRDASGALVVFAHDLPTTLRFLGSGGVTVRDVQERQATLEERFHDSH
jgi:ABC-2 type transport system ATP-binding protein